MENLLLTVFLISFLMIWTILKLSENKNWFVNEADLKGVQKFHSIPTPRIAGIPVFVSFFIGAWFIDSSEFSYGIFLLTSHRSKFMYLFRCRSTYFQKVKYLFRCGRTNIKTVFLVLCYYSQGFQNTFLLSIVDYF